MRFRVETTARAKQDLDDILIWLLMRQAGEAGLRWFQGLRDAVASLAEIPDRCGLAPEDEVFLLRFGSCCTGRNSMSIESCSPWKGTP